MAKRKSKSKKKYSRKKFRGPSRVDITFSCKVFKTGKKAGKPVMKSCKPLPSAQRPFGPMNAELEPGAARAHAQFFPRAERYGRAGFPKPMGNLGYDRPARAGGRARYRPFREAAASRHPAFRSVSRGSYRSHRFGR